MNVKDAISDIVLKIQAEYDTVSEVPEKPYFEHGTPIEIINRLSEKGIVNSYKYKRYPLIALFEDIPAKSGKGGISLEATATLIFAVETDPNYTASQRYQHSFDPILTPLYELFIKYLRKSQYILTMPNLKYEPIYHVFWGRQGLYGKEGNIFNDYLDAIELKNLELKIYR